MATLPEAMAASDEMQLAERKLGANGNSVAANVPTGCGERCGGPPLSAKASSTTTPSPEERAIVVVAG